MKYPIASLLIFLSTMTHSYYVTIFVHGLADTGNQAYNYTKTDLHGKYNPRYIIDGPLVTFNLPDAQGKLAKICRVDFTQTDLAQEGEIAALKKTYDQAVLDYPDAQGFILMGLSRGASIVANFLAIYQPNKVIAAILESIYDSTRGIINDSFNYIWQRNFARSMIGLLFWKHKLDGLKPIDLAHKMPHNIPILVVYSQQDSRVPASSTLRWVEAVRKAGHPHVECVGLAHGQHAKLLTDKDGEQYHKAVHAFYEALRPVLRSRI